MSVVNEREHLNRLNYFYHAILGQDISMSNFENRLKLQKLVYILRSEGLRFNYNFTWYIYGPYSSELTHDGYTFVRSAYYDTSSCYHPNHEDLDTINRITRARNILHESDSAELVASYLYLRDMYGSERIAEEQLMIRKPRFSQDHIQQVMREWSDRTQTN